MKLRHLWILVVFNVLWAAIMSINLELGRHLSPPSIVSWRFGLAALACALAWPWLPGPTPRGADLLRCVVMGLAVFVVGQRLQVLGNSMGSAGDSSVLMGFEPILTSVIAAIFLRERIPLARWGGFGFCLLGLALLNRVWSPDFHWTSLGASLIFVSSFLCESVFSVLGKPLSRTASPYRVVAVSLIAATLANFVWDGGTSIAQARSLPMTGWILLLYLSLICTVAGYVVWLKILEDTDVNLVVLTVFVQPIAGVIIAAVFLHEPLHWGQLWGTLTVAAGLAVGFLAGRSPVPKPQGAPGREP